MGKLTGRPHGVRYTLHQTDACRQKIRTSHIIRRLQLHFNGKLELSPTQVRSAELLLSKTLPALASVEHTGDVATFVMRLPDQATDTAAWEREVQQPIVIPKPVTH